MKQLVSKIIDSSPWNCALVIQQCLETIISIPDCVKGSRKMNKTNSSHPNYGKGMYTMLQIVSTIQCRVRNMLYACLICIGTVKVLLTH